MKYLLFTYEFPPHAGGIGRHCYELAQQFCRLGQNISVLTVRYSRADDELDRKELFRVTRIPETKFAYLNIFIGCLYLGYFVLVRKLDYILVTYGMSQLICAILALVLPFRFSITVHGSDISGASQGKISKWLFARALVKSSKIIAVSEFTRNLLFSKFEVPAEKVFVVYNGIHIERFSVSESDATLLLRKKLGLYDEKIILTLARLTPRKGQDNVIKALPAVIRRIPNIKYVIAGCGADEQKLKQLVHKYHLDNYVIFTGYVPDDEIIAYYDMCDIFVMPSREEAGAVEGFGIAFLEAGARGKPVIGGKHGGVPEVVVDGETGFLVDPHDVSELVNTIVKTLANDELAAEMGRKAQEKVHKQFTSEIMAKKTLDVIGGKYQDNLNASRGMFKK